MFLTLLNVALTAQEIQHIQPKGISSSPAYSHVVTAKGGKTIWISGQVSQNAKGEVVGKGDLKPNSPRSMRISNWRSRALGRHSKTW